MLANDDKLAADQRFAELPRMSQDEEIATQGEVVGPYRLLYEIGRGGMGSVWLAERSDGSFKRQVALKLPRLAWGAGLADRMAREREIGALLEHPAIGRMYDAGVDERGRPYLAFEYIDGQPIDAWCESQALSLRQRLTLFLQVIKAVVYAHGRLVVHRDLKPSNVLVTLDGQAHLLDFGIAKLLQDATHADANLTLEQGRVLTPHYASPEQIAGEPITVASDVYSLGVLLYELLTGVLPVAPRRKTRAAVEEAILEGDIVPASTRVKDKATARALRGELDAILTMAMQRDPQRRYATADALAQDIERYLQGETVSARPDSVAYRMRKALRRHWMGVSAVTAVLIAVLSGSAVALVQGQRAARSAERERVVKEFVADVFRVNSHVNPANAAMRPNSPVSVLEGGAQLIQQHFAGQPEMQAELFGVVGGVFSDMGAYKLAADYYTHRIEALDLMHADKVEQAKALLASAQALFDDGKEADAEVRLRRVMELSKNEPPVRLDAIALLARSQLNQFKKKEAEATIQQLEVQVSAGAASSVVKAWTTFLRARILDRQNDFDQSLALRKQAIDQALVAEGPLSETAISMRISTARYLVMLGDFKLGRQYQDEADKALRQLGGAHEVRADYTSGIFANFLLAYGAITVLETIERVSESRRRLATSNFPIPTWWVPDLDCMLAGDQLSRGDFAVWLPLYESSNAALVKAQGVDRDEPDHINVLGSAMEATGRHEIADQLFRKLLKLMTDGFKSQPSDVRWYQEIAENLRMWGKFEDANKFLSTAPEFERLRSDASGSNMYENYLKWERAALLLDQGNISASLRLLDANPPENANASDTATFNLTLGEALCTDHQTSKGLELLKKVKAYYEGQFVYSASPLYGRLWGLLGQCQLDLSDPAGARQYAAKARKVFAIQPGVSPYYKKPLQKLERSLDNHPTASTG
jgi:tetratricopeptide (TPR) repeat protein